MNNRAWRRIRKGLEASIRQRVTPAGLVFTLVTLFVALAAFVSANNLLFLLLAAMLAVLPISGFISRLSLAGLELDFSLPEHISARREVGARIRVRNEKLWIPSFSIHLAGTPPSAFSRNLYFPAIPPNSRLEEMVEVVFGRRGTHHENSFQLSTRFPFGFTERRALVSLRREILVYPSLEPRAGFEELLVSVNGDLEAHQRGRGHDFYRIRPYEALESARHVDWRATAHTGELQVREFAREQDPLVEVFLDLGVPPHLEAWFEEAIECCAFLAWRLSQREARLRFRSQEFDVCVPAEGDVYAILKYLALVSRAPHQRVLEPGEDYSYQIVFTPRRKDVEESGWAGALILAPGDFPFERF